MLPINKLQSAWQLATRLHQDQTYGGPQEGEYIPYINHIGSVAFEIMAAVQQSPQMDAELATCCALLHDTLEDTDLTYQDIRSQFGPAIADGVMALTKNKQLEGKRNQMLDSLHRIQQQPKEVWAVKMADRICNLQAPPFYWNNEKKQKYQEEARLIYRELKEGNQYLSVRLQQKIEQYGKFIDGINAN